MPLGVEVGLGPGDIVLYGDLATPPRKHVLHDLHIGDTWRIRLNRPRAGGPNESAAIRPYVKLV